MEQPNIYEFLYEKYKVKSKIKCIEFFAGYGSTTLVWNYLLEYYNKINDNKVDYEHHKICEWAIPSIIAYASLHRDKLDKYGIDFSKDLSREEIVQKLSDLGVSADYNKPAEISQLKKMKEDKLRLCYNSIIWANNLVDISRVNGDNLEIIDSDKYTYMLSYSFPCQDISNAGLSKGFSKDGNDEFSSETRSGLLWQVERILKELYNKGNSEGDSHKYLPDVLFCENVPLIETAGENLNNLLKWKNILESLGYKNYSDKLQATDYGIPQTRNRFYMFSILSRNNTTYYYKFPKKIPLKLKLKDMLEDEDSVDEKYYLSEQLIKCFMSEGTGKYPRRERFLQNICRENQDIANSITTLAGNRPTDNFVLDESISKSLKETLEKNDINDIEDVAYVDSYNRNIKTDGNSGTITTRVDASNNTYIAIKNKTKKGYLLAEEGGGIDISSRMEHHRGTVQKGKAQTITCKGGENGGVVVKSKNYSDYSLEKIKKNIVDVEGNCGAITATGMQSINHDGCQIISLKRGYGVEVKPEQENPVGIDVVGNYSKSNFNQTSIVGKNGVAPTVTENHGQVAAVVVGGIGDKKSNGGTQWYQQDRVYDSEKVAISVTTSFNPYYDVELRIRKLTPRECFRLQGVKDSDYDLLKEGQSDSKLYHLAGDSIVVNVLMAIFKEMLEVK